MLSAILQGKRRGSGLEGLSRQAEHVIDADRTGAEDLLTSTFFERLGYLSTSARDSLMSAAMPQWPRWGDLLDVDFWPRMNLQGVVVEPDVLLTMEDGFILVESKRFDFFQQQYPQQVARELGALMMERLTESALPVLMLLVGGMADAKLETVSEFQRKVRDELTKLADRLEFEMSNLDFELAAVSWRELNVATRRMASRNREEHRIFEDISAAFAFHGIATSAPSHLYDLAYTDVHAVAAPIFPAHSMPPPPLKPEPSHGGRALWKLTPAGVLCETL